MSDSKKNNNLMKIKDFAEYWQITERTVYRLIKKGLPCVKAPGVGTRVLRDQSDAFLLVNGFARAAKARSTKSRKGKTKGKEQVCDNPVALLPSGVVEGQSKEVGE